MQFPLFTALVYDAQDNGIPVAWFTTSEATTESIAKFLQSLLAACKDIHSGFEFGCTLTDNDSAELAAIRYDLLKSTAVCRQLFGYKFCLAIPIL